MDGLLDSGPKRDMEIHNLTCFLEFLLLYFFNTKVTDADLGDEIGRAKENIKETEIKKIEDQQNSEITSEGDWYWDDEIGWVQDQPCTEETNTDGDWYWDDKEGWVQNLPNETTTFLQNKLLSTKKEEEQRRQQLLLTEKENIEKLEKENERDQKRKEEEQRLKFLEQEILKKIKIQKENNGSEKVQNKNVARSQENLSEGSSRFDIEKLTYEDRKGILHDGFESKEDEVESINQDKEKMIKEEIDSQRILRIDRENKEKERELAVKKERKLIEELEKQAIEKIEQAKKTRGY